VVAVVEELVQPLGALVIEMAPLAVVAHQTRKQTPLEEMQALTLAAEAEAAHTIKTVTAEATVAMVL
jgi:hypothetical protein